MAPSRDNPWWSGRCTASTRDEKAPRGVCSTTTGLALLLLLLVFAGSDEFPRLLPPSLPFGNAAAGVALKRTSGSPSSFIIANVMSVCVDFDDSNVCVPVFLKPFFGLLSFAFFRVFIFTSFPGLASGLLAALRNAAADRLATVAAPWLLFDTFAAGAPFAAIVAPTPPPWTADASALILPPVILCHAPLGM